MKDIIRASKALDFAIDIAKCKPSVDQKKVNEIETETINALMGFRLAIEKLDKGCFVENEKQYIAL